MSLSIGIKVDTRQVKDARREIDSFDKSLVDAQTHGKTGLDIGTGDLEGTAAMLAKIREEISRMGELSRKATKGGGLLPKAQFVEASELAKRVQNDLGKWSGEIDKARAALKRLQQEKAQIGHDFMTGYLKDMAATP